MAAPISVREEELEVLVIDSRPRWEFRYLRNALERDPGVEVSCLLFHPGLPKVGGGRSYLSRFPTESELSRFRARKGRGHSVVVIYDGVDDQARSSSKGLRIVFPPRGRNADDEILREARRMEGRSAPRSWPPGQER